MSPNVGDVVRFTIEVTNAGPDVATGVALSDVVPNGYSAISNVSGTNTITGGNTIDWTGITVPANNGVVSVTYDAVVEAPVSGVSYTNNAAVSASDQFDPDSDPDTNTGGLEDLSLIHI